MEWILSHIIRLCLPRVNFHNSFLVAFKWYDSFDLFIRYFAPNILFGHAVRVRSLNYK